MSKLDTRPPTKARIAKLVKYARYTIRELHRQENARHDVGHFQDDYDRARLLVAAYATARRQR